MKTDVIDQRLPVNCLRIYMKIDLDTTCNCFLTKPLNSSGLLPFYHFTTQKYFVQKCLVEVLASAKNDMSNAKIYLLCIIILL